VNGFDVFLGLILGGFIWFFLALMLEDFELKKMKENKFGVGSDAQLTRSDKQKFYIPLAVLSAALGVLVAFLGSTAGFPKFESSNRCIDSDPLNWLRRVSRYRNKSAAYGVPQ
jgi:hypothetical protein